jgi:hypothetical protein
MSKASVDAVEDSGGACFSAGGHYRMFVKGAAKDVLKLCTRRLGADGVTPAPFHDREAGPYTST